MTDSIRSHNDRVVYTQSQPPISVERTQQERIQNVFKETTSVAPVTDRHLTDSFYGKETLAVRNELKEKMSTIIPKGAGASVLVCARGDKKPMHLGIGRTSVENGHPIDENTAAVIGSGAKMFTGLLSKVLEDKGVLSIQTKLSDVLEEKYFVIFEDPEAAKDITLEMLLSHTSGLQYHAEIFNNKRAGMSWDAILDGMVKDIASEPAKKILFTGVPGDGVYSYSNQISLAAIFIEAAYNAAYQNSGEKFTYADILMREVTLPLGMTRTSFKKPEDNVLRAYRNDGNIPKSEDADIRDPVHFPAGGLWSTAADMGKLAESFRKAFKSGEGLKSADGRVLLSSAAFEDFLRPRGVNEISALGVDVVGPFFAKGGEISTYDFKFAFDRESDSYIVSFCNFKNSPEFGGEESDGYNFGYINQVIPTLDEMHNKFKETKTMSAGVTETNESSPATNSLPLHSCDKFFYAGKGIIGMNSKEPTWINWNGEILPLKQVGKDKFLIVGENFHAGKIVRFFTGKKGNPYIFIETIPKTEKNVRIDAFKAVQSGSSPMELARINEIETLKRQRELPLKEIWFIRLMSAFAHADVVVSV